jgi:imidazolonepropionase
LRELGLIPDGAVLIVDGVIHDVGPGRRVENLAAARDADEISADGRVVMPGFVDCHTQLVCGPPLLDEYEKRIEGQTYEGGSGRTLHALRTASKQRMELDARKMIREFIRHGTTTIEATATLDAETRSEMKVLRVLASLRDKPLDLFAAFRIGTSVEPVSSEETGSNMQETLTGLRTKHLAQFVSVECGEGKLSSEEARRLLYMAKGMGFQVSVTKSAALAVEANAASVDHLQEISALELDALARSQTIAALLPGAAFHSTQHPYPPARELIDGGVAVALATGFSLADCPSCSMPAIISLACNQMRMSPAEAIAAATINGAHARRCANRLGSLEYGKDADLLMLSVSDYREIPYHFGMNMIALCMKRGDVLYPRMEFS